MLRKKLLKRCCFPACFFFFYCPFAKKSFLIHSHVWYLLNNLFPLWFFSIFPFILSLTSDTDSVLELRTYIWSSWMHVSICVIPNSWQQFSPCLSLSSCLCSVFGSSGSWFSCWSTVYTVFLCNKPCLNLIWITEFAPTYLDLGWDSVGFEWAVAVFSWQWN